MSFTALRIRRLRLGEEPEIVFVASEGFPAETKAHFRRAVERREKTCYNTWIKIEGDGFWIWTQSLLL